MRRWLTIFSVVIISLVAGIALADLNYTQGSGTTIFDFVCFTTKHCSAHVPINSAGTEIGTIANPIRIDTGTSGNLINAMKGTIPLGTTGGWTTVVKTGIVGTVQSIKASAGWLGLVQCDNLNNAWSYLQIFNVASGSVILGATSPVQIIPIAPNLSNGFVMNMVGTQYSTAISIAATTTPTGSTAVSSGLNCQFGYN